MSLRDLGNIGYDGALDDGTGVANARCFSWSRTSCVSRCMDCERQELTKESCRISNIDCYVTFRSTIIATQSQQKSTADQDASLDSMKAFWDFVVSTTESISSLTF